jgi:glutathione S-transferase
MPALPRLIVLAPSHFCERASWALERYGVEYALEPHAPGFHVPAVCAAGSGATSTPVLVLHGEQPVVLSDSAAILRWVDKSTDQTLPRLFPPSCAAEVDALCARFDVVGVRARQLVYCHALDSAAVGAALAPPSIPRWERVLWSWGVGALVRVIMRKGMDISPANRETALAALRAEFASVSELLSDGRAFLMGDQFTAADLTFAALAAPAIGHPYGEYPPFPDAASTPPSLLAATEELRNTPAGLFALRMWETERRRVLALSAPHL